MATFSGAEVLGLGGPKVYVWKRATGETLYVGQSKYGLGRILAHHETIGVRAAILDDDVFELHPCKQEDLTSLERELYLQLEPTFNFQEPKEKTFTKGDPGSCSYCGTPYPKRTRDQRFCSSKCRAKWWADRHST